MKTWFREFILHPGQAIVAWALNAFFSILPLDCASTLGGWMGRQIGPRLRVTGNARRALAVVFPLLNSYEIEKIIDGMWDNLGRTAGEHPHLTKFNPYMENSRVEVIGVEILDQARDDNEPGIAFSAHLANWELVPLVSTKRGLPLHLVYRRANNPFFDRLVQRGRASTGGQYFPKGPGSSLYWEGGIAIAQIISKELEESHPDPRSKVIFESLEGFYKKTELSLLTGLGVRLNVPLSIGLRFTTGLTHILDKNVLISKPYYL